MKNRPRKSTQQWQLLVEEQEQSQLSQKEFCSAHDLNYTSFVKWRQKFKLSNNEFLPIVDQDLPNLTRGFSLTMSWGKFSMSMNL